MLPRFINHEHIGDGWMYDYDRDGWVNMGIEATGTGTAEHQQMPAAGTSVCSICGAPIFSDEPVTGQPCLDCIMKEPPKPQPFSRRGL